MSPDRDRAREAVGILGAIAVSGRREAVVFLLGLLAEAPEEDLATRERIVQVLRGSTAPAIARALFAEVRRVESSNRTRRYLDTVIESLGRFPLDVVECELDELSCDKKFSTAMRAKFERVVEQARREEYHTSLMRGEA